MGRKAYNKQELKTFADKFIELNGRVPERRDFEGNKDYPSSGQYIREWGSWGLAIVAMGYRKTPKEKKKLKQYKCKECGKGFESYVKRKYCSIRCRDRYNSKTPRAKLDISKENYRAIAFRSYEWKCEICGTTECIEYLYGKSKPMKFPTLYDVHHIDHNRDNNYFRNLTILCPMCHMKVHRGIITNLRRGKRFLKLKYDIVKLENFKA